MQAPRHESAPTGPQPTNQPNNIYTGKTRKWWFASRRDFLGGSLSTTSEISTWAACLSIFGAVVVALRYYDGKPMPILPLSLTLNGLLQLLVTIAQSLFTISVIQKLSQLKWLWFSSEPRPLSHFQVYDDACRGGVWSLGLLLRLRGVNLRYSLLPWLSAVILISSLLTGPVTQQVLTSRVIVLPVIANVTALAPRATVMSRTNGTVFSPDSSDILSELRALISAAYLGPGEEIPQPQPSCPSADCNWDAYGSLAVCGNVANITDTASSTLLASLRTNATASLQAYYAAYNSTGVDFKDLFGQSLRNTIVLPLLEPSGQFSEGITQATLGEYTIAFTDQLINSTDDLETVQYQFLNFVLYYCTKSFNTSVAAGIHQTSELESAAAVTASNMGPLNFLWSTDNVGNFVAKNFCPPTASTLSVALDGPPGVASTERFLVDGCTGIAFSSIIYSAAVGIIVQFEDLESITSIGELSYPISRALYGDFLQSQISDPAIRFQNIQRMVGNIARSLTNFIRTNGDSFIGSNGGASGDVFAPTAVVQVRWEWLTLLACQVIMTAVVLILTSEMVRNSGLRNLRDSSITTMCTLDPDTREAFEALDDIEARDYTARLVNVKLVHGSGTSMSLVGPGKIEPRPRHEDSINEK